MTDWQHEVLEINTSAIVATGSVYSSLNPDDTVLIAKVVFTMMSEYHVTWAFMMTYQGASITAAMAQEDTSRNLQAWKTAGNGAVPGQQNYNSPLIMEWTPGLILAETDKLSFMAVQEATSNGGILGIAHVTYAEYNPR